MTAREVTDFLRDPEVSRWKKFIGLFAAIYAVSPLDLIPDFILPPIGYLDDLGVLGFCSWYFFRQVRKHAERQRELDAALGGERNRS